MQDSKALHTRIDSWDSRKLSAKVAEPLQIQVRDN
jgi:hypothetical protein